MYEVFRETVRVLERGEPCVLATVTRTKGSTPQKPGAKLLVRSDGSGVGTLGGGCVEGDIWFAAKMLLREGGGAQVKDYFLNEELAARDGLVCGGTMYFLLDPLRRAEEFLTYAREIVNAYEGGVPVAVVSLTRPAPGSDATVGARLFVWENGATKGSLGNPALDAAVVKRARELMAYGKCDYLILDTGTEVFVEAYTTPPTLVLMGGGHISRALAPLAKSVGFRIYVLDDRPEFANRERFPMAEGTFVVPSYDQGLERIPINTNTFIIIATRGHKYDDAATEAAARSRAGYVGLLGSKRKSLLIFRELHRKGVPEERIREVRAPVGLNIGGRTPEEIAVSIMAEILMCRLGGDGRPMKMEDRLFAKAKEKALEPAAQAGRVLHL
jgi:xanthine dehydrogenase accessory factor